MNDIEKLQALKKDIENAKINKSKAEGRLEGLYSQLKENHDCDTLKKAEKKLKTMKKTLNELKQERDEGLSKLKERYDGW